MNNIVKTPDGIGTLTDENLGQVVFPDGECGYYGPEQLQPVETTHIAAAPELLEALQRGISLANDVITGGMHGRDAAEDALLAWMQEARAAIARATGGRK